MIVRRFLLWARTASPGDRAEAVSALARAYLYGDLAPADLRDAETALTAMLDDPSPLVRRAMAEAFANAPDAPRHIVVALASDQSGIAALVLARSPRSPARRRLSSSSATPWPSWRRRRSCVSTSGSARTRTSARRCSRGRTAPSM